MLDLSGSHTVKLMDCAFDALTPSLAGVTASTYGTAAPTCYTRATRSAPS